MKYVQPITWLLPIIFCGCNPAIMETLSESGNYDFRKTRWGFSQERVQMAEHGKLLDYRTKDVLAYKHKIGTTPCIITYCFRDNKLRVAGYITKKPELNAQHIVDGSRAEHGEPTEVLQDGMMWVTDNTIIYANVYLTRAILGAIPEYQIGEGILKEKERGMAGETLRWDGVWAYVDIDFYFDLLETRFPLDELSFHEKLLFGSLKRTGVYTIGNTSLPLSR